jgi:hypothetical protein
MLGNNRTHLESANLSLTADDSSGDNSGNPQHLPHAPARLLPFLEIGDDTVRLV